MSSTVDIARFIDDRPVGRYQWVVFVTCMFVAAFDGYDLQSIALAAPFMAQEWGVKPTAFGPAFSLGPVGMIVGSFVIGSMADRWGRIRLITGATALFGLFSLMTVFVHSLGALAVLRLLTGFGMGGVVPNLIALTSEYAPVRIRSRVNTLTFSGIPFGSMVGGLLASWLVPLYGWHAIFYIGGLVPLAIACYIPFGLPESIRFLAVRGDNRRRISTILRKFAPDGLFPADALYVLPGASKARVALSRLFGRQRTGTTLLLAVTIACNSFMIYFLLNWLPTVMKQAGLSTQTALLATVLLNGGGGLGAMASGYFMDRFGSFRVTSCVGFTAGIAVGLIGIGNHQPLILVPALFVAGACIMGGQPGLNSLLSEVYPTAIRSTGAGAALGMGRLGSIAGPAAGGVMLSLQWDIPSIFLTAALPGFGAATALWALGRMKRNFV